MENTEQPGGLARQTRHDEDIYELRLYVVGNNRKSQLAFENLKMICFKYLAGKCHIEVINLTKNPGLAKTDQIVAIPALMRKNYPGRRIVGDLSNHEKVLEFLDLRISDLMDVVNEKGPAENIITDESKTHIVKSKRSKDDLQPYVGSDLCRRLSQNLDKLAFSLSQIPY
ncbi:MAG: circadian clock protein KaiB [Euryarchaeota archaeon]|nr:circadian clock protein KaiB [Euryarchaeota archaeon]